MQGEKWRLSQPDASELCGKGRGNPHTKQAFGITVCVLNLHMPCSHWEPQMEADFITWKSPQVARKVAKNIASSLKTHYRKSNAENSLITLHPGSVYHTLNKLWISYQDSVILLQWSALQSNRTAKENLSSLHLQTLCNRWYLEPTKAIQKLQFIFVYIK